VPSVLTFLVERAGLAMGDLPELRVVLFAGEVFPVKYLRRLMQALPHVRFGNWYGPTETNVCTAYWLDALPPEHEEIPIGQAITGVETFVIGDDGAPVEPGAVGELYVRGPTVMAGYWGDPERTSRGLVADPRAGVPAGRAYRTGDLVHEEPGGDLRFVGRRDHQVKTRGYRVELGEVETALNAHAGVRGCAVVPVPDDLMTNLLRAYVAVDTGVDERALRRHCAERLPKYMVPDQFVLVDELPTTSTGKIDRAALRQEAAGIRPRDRREV
jgi:acyl-coenzyme A synthetase/AMP-(fatty) acid ligase